MTEFRGLDPEEFYKRHIAEGRCPSCRHHGFQVHPEGLFECGRCGLRGEGIEDFIEAVGKAKLHHLRRLVREGRNRKILERQGMPRDEISAKLRELEDRRVLVWDGIVRRATRVEFVDREEKRIAESLQSIDDLVGTLAEECKQDEDEVRGHLDSLVEFGDIEIQKYPNYLGQEVTEIRIRCLWRNSG